MIKKVQLNIKIDPYIRAAIAYAANLAGKRVGPFIVEKMINDAEVKKIIATNPKPSTGTEK